MIQVKTFNPTVVTVRGEQKAKVTVQNQAQKVKIVQSVSPIPLTTGQGQTIDGGNF